MINLDNLVNILSILLNIGGLLLCLFGYFKKARKTLTYLAIFLLGYLLSNYYWAVYALVMGEDPNLSSFFAYIGWNLAFVMPAHIQLNMMRDHGVKRFSPLSLIPIPFGIAQLALYLQFGGIFNNIWQVFWATLTLSLSINAIANYRKYRDKGAKFPYINIGFMLYIIFEMITWVASCFDWPSDWVDPYYPFSILASLFFVFIPLLVVKEYDDEITKFDHSKRSRLIRIFRPVYVAIVIVFCVGGFFLAFWMRDTLAASIGEVGEADPYSVIAVMLFVISFVIISFTVTMLLIVSSEQKQLENEEMEKAKELAERSNAAKSDFLANMSHEIRTPINAVLGMNEIIFRESLKARDNTPSNKSEIRDVFSEICNYAGNIDSAGKNLLSIINDILDFSKIESGKMELVNKEYRLSSVLNDVSNMISFKAESKGLKFDVDVDSTVPDLLMGDEVRVRQIITNILNNAVKYTQKGSIVLYVKKTMLDKADGEPEFALVISVKDTGMGIKDEDKEKLFKKFQRIDLEKNSTIEGTGLGLAITVSLLEMMGGKIDVQSQYGLGSVFTVTIPQKKLSNEPIGDFRDKFEKSIKALHAKKEPFHAKDALILIVDDTMTNLVVAKGLLKNTMINIDTATSGLHSIEMCKIKTYDLILMDQRMPEMDGTTAMNRIKKDPESINKTTPFIALTADAVSGAEDRYLNEGFNDYLSKPIDSGRLEELLIKYLPASKVIYTSDESTKVHSEETGPSFDKPDIIDKETGMTYCEGDAELYAEILSGYLRESKKKSEAIDESYAARDWHNYGVFVHSLKSTSKMVGATKLSEIAARLEKAADAGDESAIEAEHETMRGMYQDVILLISRELAKK